MRVPVTIVGGFLGAGKTSLLNHVLTNASGKRIAALVNDFGAINIDAKLIVEIEGETISLANGCVCCVMRDDLLVEILKLFEKEPLPEHIVIETSGVSKPLAVAETFVNPATQNLVDLQGIISVVDAELVMDENAEYADVAVDQIRYADLVVINKTDLVEPLQLAELKGRIEAIAERSRIWETTFGVVSLDLFFDDRVSDAFTALREGALGPGPRNEHHDRTFATWTYRSDAAWPFSALQRAVERLPKGIYRAKGIVRLDLDSGDYGVLQVTGKRSWLRLCEPGAGEPIRTELVFIGKPGATSDEALRLHMEDALQDAVVRARSGEGYVVSDLRAFNVVFA